MQKLFFFFLNEKEKAKMIKMKKSKIKPAIFGQKAPTGANIAQHPVAHAHIKGAPKGSSDLCSLSVALVLVLLYYIL